MTKKTVASILRLNSKNCLSKPDLTAPAGSYKYKHTCADCQKSSSHIIHSYVLSFSPLSYLATSDSDTHGILPCFVNIM